NQAGSFRTIGRKLHILPGTLKRFIDRKHDETDVLVLQNRPAPLGALFVARLAPHGRRCGR
ncbi:MAG: hypothetical protein M3N13_01980, partial [Candidatus Eremiobacteraeota bacterium]|nr:hypothetical protein [Candidatus Eremiobacteraeota bacterium]